MALLAVAAGVNGAVTKSESPALVARELKTEHQSSKEAHPKGALKSKFFGGGGIGGFGPQPCVGIGCGGGFVPTGSITTITSITSISTAASWCQQVLLPTCNNVISTFSITLQIQQAVLLVQGLIGKMVWLISQLQAITCLTCASAQIIQVLRFTITKVFLKIQLIISTTRQLYTSSWDAFLPCYAVLAQPMQWFIQFCQQLDITTIIASSQLFQASIWSMAGLGVVGTIATSQTTISSGGFVGGGGLPGGFGF